MSKLPHIGTSIFSVMSKMATQHNAINLSQGFPNFPVDPVLIEKLKSISEKNVHQYLPMSGHPELMEKIADLTSTQYHRKINTQNELLITAGATQAIFTTIQAIVSAHHNVVVLDPSYDCYAPAIALTGAQTKHVYLNDDFSPNWQEIEKSIDHNTKMLIINNPHNPSGSILSLNDFEQLEKILDLYPELILLSDEVYEYITFEQKHISANSRKKLQDRSVIISSFGKTFHITGWKIGYLIAPEHLMVEIKKVHQYLVFCVNSVAQNALNAYLPEVDVNLLGKFYQEKRDLFRSLIQNSAFELLPSDGTYFQLASFANISNLSDIAFCQELVIKHGVAAIPLSPFYQDHKDQKIIRFCFAKDTETLIKAAEKLCKI